MRRQLDSKPKIYPEGMDVNVAGISVKVNAHYPGRSAQEQRAEVSRGHSKLGFFDQDEGLNGK